MDELIHESFLRNQKNLKIVIRENIQENHKNEDSWLKIKNGK